VKGHGSKFGRKMEAAVAALLTQRNVEEAARTVGVPSPLSCVGRSCRSSRRLTAKRGAWRTHKQWPNSSKGTTAAATTLLKVMLDQGTPASVRVRAAECIMNHSAKAIEIEDVEARVTELERAADESKQGR
jgi:hypothetical protein